MVLIRSNRGGGYVAEVVENGKRLVTELEDVVAAAEWAKDAIEEVKESEHEEIHN